MLLFARPQRHARHRAHGIIGLSPVSRFPPTAAIRTEGGSCPQGLGVVFLRALFRTIGLAFNALAAPRERLAAGYVPAANGIYLIPVS
jgi:hypothetical protein